MSDELVKALRQELAEAHKDKREWMRMYYEEYETNVQLRRQMRQAAHDPEPGNIEHEDPKTFGYKDAKF